MSEPTPPTLDYRTLGPEDRELEAAADEHAKWLGCWTTVALVIGLPVLSGFLVSAWMFRDQIGTVFWFLLYSIGIILAGLALLRAVRRSGRWRPFLGGLALGFAGLAIMLAIAFAVAFLLNLVID